MKYERFTEKVDSGFVGELDCRIAYNKLCDIENKIEHGVMIELPCKVGDTVYVCYSTGIDEWEVSEITIIKNNMLFRLTHDGTDHYNAAWLSEAGTYLFFTREEAEKRLKELQNERL